MFSQGQFINSAATTPEELARKRAEIAAMMPRFGNARYVGEGLGQLFMGIGLGRQQKALDGQEREGRAAAQDRLNAVFGGGLTGRARPGDFTVLGPSGTFIAAPPPPKPTESFMGKPDTIFEGGNTFGLPAAPAPQPSQPLSFGSSAMTPQEMLIEGAKMRGLNPVDVATAISYETGGTFDPLIQGPTTQWGTHDGLIQFGDPQAVEHGAVFDQGVDRAWQSQLDPKNGAVWSYLESTGVQPGMGLDQIYSAINAGGINRFGASDADNGGAPGTVADKVAGMAPHRENAAKFLGGTWISDPNGAQPVNVNSPQMTAATMPTDALMALVMDPWQPPEVRAMAQTMLQEQQRMNDPAYTMGLRADELAIQKAEAELEAIRNPAPTARTRIVTGEDAAALGLDPALRYNLTEGPEGVEASVIGGGGTTIVNDLVGEPAQFLYGTDAGLPAGWRLDVRTGEASVIPGGPADAEAIALADKGERTKTQTQLKLGTTLENINLNIADIENGGLPVTGAIGDLRRTWLGRAITGDGAMDFGNRTNQITDSAALAEVQNMRDNSPTGGAVGSLTDDERRAIGNAVTSLNNSTSAEEYARAAKNFRKLALDLAYGEGTWELDENGQPRIAGSGNGTTDAEGWTTINGVKIRVKQ